MAKSKRTPRAKHKVGEAYPGELIKVDADPSRDAPRVELRVRSVAFAKATLSAELEAVIEIIARERVYRAMLDGLRGRLLSAPPLLIDPPHPGE